MDHQTIHTLEGIMAATVDPKNALSPLQLHDVMEMMLTDLHLRKVGGEFWVHTCNEILDVCRAAVEINTIATLMAKLPGLDEQNKKVMTDLLELTINETNDLRRKLVPKVNLLKEMPCPGETLH